MKSSPKDDFPAFARQRAPWHYLDSAASSQKPAPVIETLERANAMFAANVHRGAHRVGAAATDAMEQARARIAAFVNAPDPDSIVFTGNATMAINTVAQSFARRFLSPGDAVLITEMEHHANIVPWQMLRDTAGIELRVAPISERGALDLDALGSLMTPAVKLIALTHISNVLGTVNPVADIIDIAHRHGARVLVDGSQGAVHLAVDVQRLDVDFYCFTGHKLYGPTGIGVLYGKPELLAEMPPVFGGGEMIEQVSFEEISYAPPPARFEPGTPPITGAIGLGAAIDYLQAQGGAQAQRAREEELRAIFEERLLASGGIRILGTAPDKAGITSFVADWGHPYDIATLVDESHGVAVRAGHHCAQPLHRRLGVSTSVRASLALYNDREDVDALIDALGTARSLLS